MSSSQKKGIIVLGCHRSGTSAVTGLLKLYDVYLGTDLLQPGSDNPKGFFEHSKIVRLNDCFMDQLDIKWWQPVPIDYLQSIMKQDKFSWLRNGYQNWLKQIIKREIATHGIWAVKDPRLTRMMPLTNPVFKEFGKLTYLIVRRDEQDIIKSLAKRHNCQEGEAKIVVDNYLDHLNYFVNNNTDIENILTVDFDAWKSGKVLPQENMKSLEKVLGISSFNKQPSDEQIKEYLEIIRP